MKSVWQYVVVALVALAVGAAADHFFLGAPARFGMVDMTRVLNESELGKDYTSKLNDQAAKYQGEISKITDPAQKSAKSSEYSSALAQLQSQYRDDVYAKADSFIAGLAKKRGIQAVFGTDVLRYAPIDLTEEVVKGLKKQ